MVLDDGVDEEVEFWEGVQLEEGVGVDGLDDLIDRESWWMVSVWGCFN